MSLITLQDWALLTLPHTLRNGPYSPLTPCSAPAKKKKKSPALFTTSCFNFQDQFYAAKGHLFALLDQHEKCRVCAWDADRWPLARQQS